MRDIGKNIRLLRQSRNMTQDELAETLFVTRQTVSNYETGKSRPDVEMLVRIAEVLGTDIHRLIYGPEPVRLTREIKRLIIGSATTAALLLAIWILAPIVKEYQRQTFLAGPSFLLNGIGRTLMWLCMGWTLAHLLGMALKQQPLQFPWVIHARRAAVAIAILCLVTVFVYSLVITVDGWLYANHIRGVWEETTYIANGVTVPTKVWSSLPLPTPRWFNSIAGTLLIWVVRFWPGLLLCGGALWLLGFPSGKKDPQ